MKVLPFNIECFVHRLSHQTDILCETHASTSAPEKQVCRTLGWGAAAAEVPRSGIALTVNSGASRELSWNWRPF